MNFTTKILITFLMISQGVNLSSQNHDEQEQFNSKPKINYRVLALNEEADIEIKRRFTNERNNDEYKSPRNKVNFEIHGTHKVIFKTYGDEQKQRGFLAELNDETIGIIDIELGKLKHYHITNIKSITGKRTSMTSPIIAGVICGSMVGLGMGSVHGPVEGFFERSSGEVALISAAMGAGVGSVIGTIVGLVNFKVQIQGDKTKYVRKRRKLNRYVVSYVRL